MLMNIMIGVKVGSRVHTQQITEKFYNFNQFIFLAPFDILLEDTEKCYYSIPGNFCFKVDMQCFQSISLKGTAVLVLLYFSASFDSGPRLD